MTREDIIADILAPGLRVVFCGTQPGAQSAARRAYYAGRGNRFWPTLHQIGLTPRRLEAGDFREVLQFGIGLTDLAKQTSGPDSVIKPDHVDVARLRESIRRYRPKILAFNSKKAASYALERPTGQLAYGAQDEGFEGSRVFVLPSTSGLASGLWDIRHWHALAESLGGIGFGENGMRNTPHATT